MLSPNAADVAARHRIRAIRLSLTHDKISASAVALAIPERATPSLAGRLFYEGLRIRRGVVLANLRRVFNDGVDDEEIKRLAQAHYGHLLANIGEFIRMRWSPRRGAHRWCAWRTSRRSRRRSRGARA